MEEKILLSGWRMYAYGGTAIALLLIGIFRLDELFTRKPRRKRLKERSPARHPSGRPEFSDPDGRAWKVKRK